MGFRKGMALLMIENGTIPLAWFVGVALLWVATVVYGHRLRRHFVAKYPEVASKDIPYAFSHVAHPEKALFFLRRKARDVLRNDRELFKQRQRFVWLSVLSLIAPFAGFAAVFVYAMLHR
jgi:uncharacterized membrane protein (DUF485 family)